jgi:replicative DNA helicase
MTTQFTAGEAFQETILACLVRHPSEFTIYATVLKSSYFTGVQATLVARCLLDYHKERARFPSFVVLNELAVSAAKGISDNIQQAELISDFVKKLEGHETGDWPYVRDHVVKFAKEQSVVSAMREAIALLKEGKIPADGFSSMFAKAMEVGTNVEDLGYILHQDSDKVVDKVSSEEYGISTGYPLWDKVWRNGWGPGWLVVPLAPPKRWKCLGKGTKVIMFDGSLKSVEDIKIGDQLMGDDSTPRTVHDCGCGRGPMYRVDQTKGISYECNDAHILCLTDELGRHIEMTAEEYFQKAKIQKTIRRQWQGYSVGVEFSTEGEVPLEPYFFGAWLGDGTSAEASITICDAELEVGRYVEEYASRLGMKVAKAEGDGCHMFSIVCNKKSDLNLTCKRPGCTRKEVVAGYCASHYVIGRRDKIIPLVGHRTNKVLEALRSLGVVGNKHIPSCYLRGSQEVRLQVLAGLIDTDGSYVKDLGFVIGVTPDKLADQVVWLAQSLGFRSFKRLVKTAIKSTGYRGVAWRVVVAGSVSEIPIKLPHKKPLSDSKKHRFNNKKIRVTPIGDGEWCGITIDGNRRFLLEDFTVTHNTGVSINLALNMVGPAIAENVLYYACEISQELAMMRALSNIARQPFEAAIDSPERFKAAVKNAMQTRVAAHCLFKSFASQEATIADIRAHAHTVVSQLGIKPRVIVIDYAETVRPSDKREQDHRQQSSIYTEARALGTELGCTIIMPDRCNRETVGKSVPNMTAFAGSFQKAGIVDVAIGLCSTEEEHLSNTLRTFTFLNRHGPSGQHVRGRVDPQTWKIELVEEIPYDPDAGDDDDRPKKKKRSRGPVDEVDDV